MPTWLGTRLQRLRALLILVIVALVLLVLARGATALVPFFIGAVLAYILLPAVDFMESHAPRQMRGRRITRTLSIILVYLILFGLLGALLAYLLPALMEQMQQLVRTIPELFSPFNSRFATEAEALLERIPESIRSSVEEGVQTAIRVIGDALQKGLQRTAETVWQTVTFIVGLFIVPIWVFMVLNSTSMFRQGFYRMLPVSTRADVHNILDIIDDLASSYLRGQLILCVVVGVMSTTMLLIFDVRLALLLGTIAGLFEVIPNIGPFIGAVPAVLLALVDSPIKALWVAIGFIVIQQVENAFLVPRIAGQAVRFHPAIIIVLVLVGGEVAGLWGMLLAVPLVAIVRDVSQYLFLRTTEKGATPQMAIDTLRARAL